MDCPDSLSAGMMQPSSAVYKRQANYVLKRVFKYFGYDLKENFFTKTEPFNKIDVYKRQHLL